MKSKRQISALCPKRVTRGALGNIAVQGVNTASQILLVPVFLSSWGANLYGEWLVLTAAVFYLSLLDGGMQNYVVNRLTQSRAAGDLREYNRILHTAFLIYGGVALVAAALVWPLAFAAPLSRWLNLPLTGPGAVSIVAALLASQVIVSIPLGVVCGIYKSAGEYPREMAITLVVRSAMLASTAAAVLLGGGLVHVALVQALVVAASLIFCAIDVRVRHRWIEFGLARADLRLGMSYFHPSLMFFLMQISFVVTVQGSTILVNDLMGAAAVALFATLRTLTNLIRQGTLSLFNSLWPEFTVLQTSGDHVRLREAHQLFSKFVMLATLCGALFVYLAGESIVHLWTGGRVPFAAGLLVPLLLHQVTQSWWMMSSLVLASSNNHRGLALCQASASLSGLALGYFLAPSMGVAGVAYGIAVADAAICGVAVPVLACRLTGESVTQHVAAVLFRLLPVAAPMLIVIPGMAAPLAPWPLPRMAFLAVAIAAASLTLGFTLYLSGSERQRIRGLLAPHWKRAFAQ